MMPDVVLMVDAGGVLFNNVTEDSDFMSLVADRYGIGVGDLVEGLDANDADYETGRRDVVQVLADIVAAHEPSARDRVLADVDWLQDTYGASVIPRWPAFAGVRQARERHPQLTLVLANNEARRWDEVKDRRFGHFALFDELVSSWRIGQMKPSGAYIAAVAERLGVYVARLVLVDDNPDVLDAAAGRGLAGVEAIGRWPADDIDRAIASARKG